MILNWLFSSNSAGILTITTGFIAWFVYKKQVLSREREATIVLLNEIRNAESALDAIKNSGFDVQNETISILSSCSWDKNYQIFARYLDRDEFELLSKFFNGCKASQEELMQWRNYFVTAREEKARAMQVKLLDIADENDDDINSKRRERLIKRANKEDFLFDFKKPKSYFSKYIETIPRISGTTVMKTLKKIAKEK